MKNLDVRKLYALGVGAVGLSVVSLFAAATVPASAQAGPGTITAQQAIHDLKADYGIMIIPRDGVDLNTIVSSTVAQNGLNPTMAVAQLANAIDARSRMIFIVVPASADRPATTLADAQSFENAQGNITLQLDGLPAEDAISAVAAADNAGVDLRSDVGEKTVSLNGTNISVADAIARIAAQTNTHWIEAYELTPPTPTVVARNGMYHRRVPYLTLSMDEGPLGPVIFHPTPVPVEQPAAPPAATSGDAANDIANSNPAVDQANATPTQPANPYDNGYAPYFVMQNGYGWDNGTPYPQTWSGFSNGGYIPGSGLYLTPGFGGVNPGWYGGPIVSGGTSTTTGF